MAIIVQANTDLAGNSIVAIIGDPVTQPGFDLYIVPNGRLIINEDPLIPTVGFMSWVDSGGLIYLIPINNLDCTQYNPEPANDVLVYQGNKSFISDFPLQLDAGLLLNLDSGSLFSLDQRSDDVYSGMTNNRPGSNVSVTDFMSIDSYGPYVLDSGIVFSLTGAGNSLLSIN